MLDHCFKTTITNCELSSITDSDSSIIGTSNCCALSNGLATTMLSSYNVNANCSNYSYSIIRGYDKITWSINSEVGHYTGNIFDSNRSSFAESFANANPDIEIPNGRLLQLSD